MGGPGNPPLLGGWGTKAVLFDFYDTLAYLDPAVIEAGRRELARRAGVAVDDFAPLWRENRKARMLGTAGDLATQLRDMLGSIVAAPEPAVIAELVELEERSWRRAVRLYPDSKPTLRKLRRRGLKLGILSNCSCQAGAVIRSLGLPKLVDAVVLSFEVGLAKPDPAIYRKACAALEVAPSACAFVADGAGGELEAAGALGLFTVKIRRPNQHAPEDFAVRADRRVESLEEVPGLL